MILYTLPSCCKCDEVIKLFKKLDLDVKVISIFDNIDTGRALTLDNGLPMLEVEDEWLDFEMILKRYRERCNHG
ncbi:glutaredoxin domain-containing protein [Metabacillus sp. B2-18]|uniref:glutaredoxin domain-containing protein n=1 Tax=Metabacillus sp. B2-18 TaxID=2897333 RepID=UPI001E4D8439|nr:glutaredoxin domain-containing protein [Metabacillus sp. B2-18]UGB30966.1 hypothetical protein LPC09_25325 [Metabacillus sp. B2-18]